MLMPCLSQCCKRQLQSVNAMSRLRKVFVSGSGGKVGLVIISIILLFTPVVD